ncbi:hypothetical protein [Facklamia sp. 7083-14-GEN3]|uniref:hypothetical protein n=1 Tax=Facklamia sp. 7083-14-GEN3 TaxID=2973478 RepID=UPI00215D1D77|nr:hypothetical protein [Facklamia sp. 7083-14-GEN3]MCR8968880.1 hypothetical protein [Facklamia sp. 7083-14-GEN3]
MSTIKEQFYHFITTEKDYPKIDLNQIIKEENGDILNDFNTKDHVKKITQRLIQNFPKGKEEKQILLAYEDILKIEVDDLLIILKESSNISKETKTFKALTQTETILVTPEDRLIELKQIGLDHLILLIETGSDPILNFHNQKLSIKQKGIALKRLEKLGIDYSIGFVLGYGGSNLSEKHTIESAKFLNKTRAKVVFMMTYQEENINDLNEEQREEFQVLSDRQSLEETLFFLNHLRLETFLDGSHYSNTVALSGNIPEDKDQLIKRCEDKLFEWEEKPESLLGFLKDL